MMMTTQAGWFENLVARCWELHDERGRLVGQVGSETVCKHIAEPSFRAWIAMRFCVPLSAHAGSGESMAWIREQLGEAIYGIVSGMPLESPLT